MPGEGEGNRGGEGSDPLSLFFKNPERGKKEGGGEKNILALIVSRGGGKEKSTGRGGGEINFAKKCRSASPRQVQKEGKGKMEKEKKENKREGEGKKKEKKKSQPRS